MRRLVIAFMLLGLGWASHAQAAEAPAQVVQIFGCHLADGQTGDNVWALMDALRVDSETRGNMAPEFGMFVWLPFRGSTPYDFVFGVMSKDLNTMAADSMAYYSSPGSAAIGQRFQAMEGCDSGIIMSEQISDGPISMSGGDRSVDAVVETFSCKLNDGADMGDVDSAVEFWQAQVQKINSSALNDYLAYLWTPFRGNSGTSDFIWVGNAADLAAWARGASDYSTSAAGQAADKRFDAISSCTNQLWMGYWVVAPSNF